MMSIFKTFLEEKFRTQEKKYLDESISLSDIERRQKQISLGEAPFQKYGKIYATGMMGR